MQPNRAGWPLVKSRKMLTTLCLATLIIQDPPLLFFCLISFIFFSRCLIFSMNTTIISDLFLLGSSVNDKSPVYAGSLPISSSVSNPPSLMKERWEISRVKEWDRCYCLFWMSLMSDGNFYHFCHHLFWWHLVGVQLDGCRWFVLIFVWSKSIIVLDFVY